MYHLPLLFLILFATACAGSLKQKDYDCSKVRPYSDLMESCEPNN